MRARAHAPDPDPDHDHDHDPEGDLARARATRPPEIRSEPPRRDRFAESFERAHPDDVWAFEQWAKAFGKTGAVFDSKRASCLVDRRREGMTRDDVLAVLAGAKLDDYVMGRGKFEGRANNRLSFIFGDRERYEEFLERGREEAARRRQRHGPPDAARRDAERKAEEERLNAQALEEAKRLGLVDEHGNRIRPATPIRKLIEGIG